jgi:hypothetical protein
MAKDALGHGSDARGGSVKPVGSGRGRSGNRAVREQTAMRMAIDERHQPTRTNEQRAALSVTPPSGTAGVVSAARSAGRQGYGPHAAGVTSLAKGMTLAAASAAGTNQNIPPPIIRGTR